MSVVEMTVATEIIPEAPASEEIPAQETLQSVAPKKTWRCSKCDATIEWLPEKVRHLHPSKILCLHCQKARKASEAPSTSSAHEAPKRAPHQRRPAGGPQDHRAQAPRGLTLELVELCAFRSGIAPSQVKDLLDAIRGHLTPSTDK